MTAPSLRRLTNVQNVGRALLLLGGATTAIALFAPWQGRGSVDEARFCQCYSTSLHASPPVVAWFLLVGAGAAILATVAGRRTISFLSYGTILMPIALGFTYFLAYLSTGASDPSIEVQVRWGVVALGVGVILLAAGFVIVALTEGPNEGELTRSVPEQPRVLPASSR